MVIWKYPLTGDTLTRLGIPRAGKVLCVQMQFNRPTLWVQCDPKAPEVQRAFRVIGTGWDFAPFAGDYIGTVQDGSFVWHVYEVK